MTDVIDRIVASGDEPISAKTLSKELGVSEIDIRRIINQVRSEGYPICSCRKGYFYSEKTEHIRKTVNSLKNRIASIQNAINGLSDNLGVNR